MEHFDSIRLSVQLQYLNLPFALSEIALHLAIHHVYSRKVSLQKMRKKGGSSAMSERTEIV